MFLLIPLLLIVFSLGGIATIIWRKRLYLNKVYTLNTAGGDGTASVDLKFNWKYYGWELFPELKTLIDKIEVNKYKTHWLLETEKLLRKMRLVFLKVDRLSDGLIKKIRKVHLSGQISQPLSGLPITPSVKNQVSSSGTEPENSSLQQTVSSTFLKNEEERLIIEIAKNPKDAKLYEALGDLYVEMLSFIDAKESYEAAIELNPQNESLKQKLSSALEGLMNQSQSTN